MSHLGNAIGYHGIMDKRPCAGRTGDCLYPDPMFILKLKQEASGWPTWCTPEVEKAVVSGMEGARNFG